MMSTSKKFAVFDIDGTLYRGNLSWDFFHTLIDEGLVPSSVMKELEASYIAHDTREHDNAYKDFDLRLVEQFMGSIRRITNMEKYWQIGQKVGAKNATRLYKFTRSLFLKLKAEGYTMIAITNAVGAAAKPFATQVGFDCVLSNEELLHSKSGRVTGWTIIENPRGKGILLDELVQSNNFAYEDSYGIGDTAADAPLLERVDFPIAFNPEKQLRTMAAQNGWTLILERKNSVYCLRPSGKDFILDNSIEDELLERHV